MNAVHRVRGTKLKLLYYWLYYVKLIGHIDLICNKATIAHFTLDKFRNLNMILPLQEEIYDIENGLDCKINEIDKVIENIKLQTIKITEAKESLISEVVTWKIEILE